MKMIPRKRQRIQHPLTLRDAVHQMFDDSFWDPLALMRADDSFFQSQFVPSIDIAETDSSLEITADVPGYNAKDISVEIDDGTLMISGSMQDEHEQKQKKHYCKQCSRGSFYQKIALPIGCQEDEAECYMKNGKLTIAIPKNEMQQNEKRRLDIVQG